MGSGPAAGFEVESCEVGTTVPRSPSPHAWSRLIPALYLQPLWDHGLGPGSLLTIYSLDPDPSSPQPLQFLL